MAKQKAISNYISAYNSFDIEGMLKNLHEEVIFRNVTNGEVNLETIGITAFEEQAKRARDLFRERTQLITGYKEYNNKVEVAIDYHGVLAVDVSEHMKAGDTIQLKGVSIFAFQNDKIILIEDRS